MKRFADGMTASYHGTLDRCQQRKKILRFAAVNDTGGDKVIHTKLASYILAMASNSMG